MFNIRTFDDIGPDFTHTI